MDPDGTHHSTHILGHLNVHAVRIELARHRRGIKGSALLAMAQTTTITGRRQRGPEPQNLPYTTTKKEL